MPVVFRRLRLLFWVLTAAWWTLIAVLTHLPPEKVPHVSGGDKLHHFCAYGGLATLLGFAFLFTFPRRKWLPLTILVIGMLYGAADEQTQKLVRRTCDVEDWYADVVGTVAGLIPVVFAQRFLPLPAAPRRRRKVTVGDAIFDTAEDAEPLSPELEAALDAVSESDAGSARRRRFVAARRTG